MIRFVCVLCIVLAVFWAVFSPSVAFNTEIALRETERYSIKMDPIDFFFTYAGTIKEDCDNAVRGLINLGNYDNVLDTIKAFFPAIGNFCKYGFITVLDLVVSPTIFAVDALLTFYNIMAVWLGLPNVDIWIDPLSTYLSPSRGR